MKNIIVASLLAVAAIGLSKSAHAKSLIEDKVLGRHFCIPGKLNTGWGFTNDGGAFYFAPNAGMPNPDVYFKVEYLRSDDQFQIAEYSRSKPSLPVRYVGHFFYDKISDAIGNGESNFSASACSF